MGKELRDQSAHAISCFFVALLSAPIPVIGMAPAVLFAITREYYQEKRKMEAARRVEPRFTQIFEMMDLSKLDLNWSYAGAFVGNLVSCVAWYAVYYFFIK